MLFNIYKFFCFLNTSFDNDESTENLVAEEFPPPTVMHQDENTVSSSTEKCNWLQNFKIPWCKMPNSMMNTLNKGEKPSTSERRQMVRIISDEIRKFTHLPRKKAIDFITKNVVEKYPSLKDNLCGDIISDGNVYLSKQIRNRLENLNRGWLVV